jgi:hypothetical protein
MNSVNVALLTTRETRMISTVISLTRLPKFVFKLVDPNTRNDSSIDIAVVSVNDEVAQARLI